ncbi:hypothetical protein [Streptomyces clavifer]|uniref:hypothetical protein n=1 Tax=Streptomyces clavifer TaxID=68188 RepID=UPI0033A0579F
MSADEARTLMSAPGNDHLTWNTPLSEEHAARLIAACAPAPGARIADFGRGERWALAHPGHPPQADVTAAVDARRTGYYGGYRGTPGLAYLVLSA